MTDAADHPGRRILATGVPIDCVNAPALAGLSLACYNPQKDYGGRGARDLVTLLRDVF